jgi:bifunctional oligoribonuclease and PAP phosphatase NrnA
MALDWQPLRDLVAKANCLLLTTHTRPDGDGLGSCKAFAAVLRQLGKKVFIVVPGHFPDRYHFLDPEREIMEFSQDRAEELRQADAACVLDTGTWNQLGNFAEFFRSLNVPKLVIDHHMTQDDMGAIRLVDVSAEATGRLAYDAIAALGCTVTPQSATALFTAIAMDTGWFRHSNTTGATLRLAASLVDAGAQPHQLHPLLFERNSMGRMKLMGCVLNRLLLAAGGRIGHSSILKTDYPATGAVPPDSEDLVNLTLSIIGVEVGLLFMEQPQGGVKVSFRSKGGVNVGQVAEFLGGGGHAPAAGAIVHEPLEEVRDKVLKLIEEVLPPLQPVD